MSQTVEKARFYLRLRSEQHIRKALSFIPVF